MLAVAKSVKDEDYNPEEGGGEEDFDIKGVLAMMPPPQPPQTGECPPIYTFVAYSVK